MAAVISPYKRERTVGNVTYYRWEGKDFVRKKSSLTRKRVLHSPRFERTRYHAGLMAKASTIGSFVYNGLPVYWRQGWMYRSFTGEALTLLKAGKQEPEIKQLLWKQYVQEVAGKQKEAAPTAAINTPAKRAYRKQNTDYWNNKTIKRQRRKARKERIQRNASLLAQASIIASGLYRKLPLNKRGGGCYQQLTGMAMRFLKENQAEQEVAVALQPELPAVNLGEQGSGTNLISKKQSAIYINSSTGDEGYHTAKPLPTDKKKPAVTINSPTVTIIAPLYKRISRIPVNRVPMKPACFTVLYKCICSVPANKIPIKHGCFAALHKRIYRVPVNGVSIKSARASPLIHSQQFHLVQF